MLEIGSVDETLGEFREAQNIEANSLERYRRIGDILYGKMMIDETIGEYRKAIRQWPKEAALHAKLGICIWIRG